MGFFSFFSKEKKETLDKGLSKTKESVYIVMILLRKKWLTMF